MVTLPGHGTLLTLMLAAVLAVPPASLANAICYRGINISGAEFGKRGGVYGTDYTYPSEATIAYFAGKGFNTIRLPFLWERLQPELEGPLDPVELRRLENALAMIRSHGLYVILDPHNYARYDGRLIGSEDVSREAFADFWKRLAENFGNRRGVLLGLMNEPHGILAEEWRDTANAAISAIRATGATGTILVPGTSWSGAHSWDSEIYGGSNAAAMQGLADPANNMMIEFHQYFDTDFSGTTGNCDRADEAVAAVSNVTEWLRKTGNRGFLGEFGIPAGEGCTDGLKRMVSVVEDNPGQWAGWAYWVAGDWWPEDEELNIQPTAAGDRPQLQGLTPFLSKPLARKEICGP